MRKKGKFILYSPSFFFTCLRFISKAQALALFVMVVSYCQLYPGVPAYGVNDLNIKSLQIEGDTAIDLENGMNFPQKVYVTPRNSLVKFTVAVGQSASDG